MVCIERNILLITLYLIHIVNFLRLTKKDIEKMEGTFTAVTDVQYKSPNREFTEI